MTPKVSVVIPLYNGARYITKTVDSVLAQTFKDYEIVIADDGSTDGSSEILHGLYGNNIKYFKQDNSGISSARNMAIRESRGEFIALLDHDDMWFPDKLAKQMELFNKIPGLGLVYSNSFIIDGYGARQGTLFDIEPPHSGYVFYDLLRANFIPVMTALIRKSVINETGLFNEQFRIVEDWDFFLRIAKIYEVGYIDEPLAEYRVHPSGFSKKRILMLKELNEVIDLYTGKEKVERKKLAEMGIYRISAGYKVALAIAYINDGDKKNSMRILRNALRFRAITPKLFFALFLLLLPHKPARWVINHFTSTGGLHATPCALETSVKPTIYL